ncbi:unnamed protein product [Pieris macdunnoughi]|uniref:DUF4781 domain-containing protein n=1 Tax=Pieris macdunnoughi TaxID=345717 RepID=A0A821WBT5_9NEOP|nr:unnamed protein product [Pieris macdunnoughi]
MAQTPQSENTENDTFPEINLSPVQIQQQYFENLPDCDWIKYDRGNRKHLMQNIAFALFGTPTKEGNLLENSSETLEGYTSRQKEQVLNVYKKICNQTKYSFNNDDLMVSILLIVCVKPKPLKLLQFTPSDYWVDLHNRTDVDMWCTAVFKVRKCIPTTVDSKPCRIYIDENTRVYQDWQSVLTDNMFPKCVIVAPQNGEYRGVIVEEERIVAVKLTVTPSPALGLKSRVLSSVDTVNTVASLGAVGVLGVAAFTPVGPAVLAGAAVATVATGLYGIVRSSFHLRDRRVHEQSIGVTNSEARGSWLNIAASGVGLGSGLASTLLSRSAAAGTNLTKTGEVLAASVEVLRRANLISGGAGVLNSLVHLIIKYKKHGEKATKLELFQFSASMLFFFQAAMSNRTAQNIIEDAQANTINEYRATLRSNRHRKAFDKLSAESRRISGAIQGNTEVICGIKNIANKDQYFADVLRINKDINQHKLRISMTADGRVNLNAAHTFEPSQLYGLGKDGRSQLFSTLGPAKVNTPNVPTKVVPSSAGVQIFDNKEEETSTPVGIRPEEVLRIGIHLVRVSASGAENIASLLENLSKDIYDALMTAALNVLSNLVPAEIAKLKLISPDEDLIQQIVNFVFNYLKHQRPMGESREDDNGIVIILKDFFQNGVLRKETIMRLKDKLMEYIDGELEKRRNRFPNKNQIICPDCEGVRYA